MPNACNGLAFCQNVKALCKGNTCNKELSGIINERVKVMGRHEIGEDGISYSIAKRMENEADRAEIDIRTKLIRIHRKCVRFMLHNGTHIGSLVGLHVVAIAIIEKSPMHYILVILTH